MTEEEEKFTKNSFCNVCNNYRQWFLAARYRRIGKVGVGFGDEGCPPAVRCPTKCTEYSIMAPRFVSMYIHADNTLSNTKNNAGKS